MKKFAIAVAAFGALAAAGVGLSGPATAIPLAGQPADSVVRTLESEGYTVRLNQSTNVPLSRCTVTSVNGLRGTTDAEGDLKDPGALNVAFVEVSCPSHA